ncbi:hypothetical protein K469DRAFT_694784 [Zopfia rhizophila CBS 207.26]|uniref:NAD(P)-binding protein n=1 Tax=Zopfia rhizophila CBS 207.26 TaxID=1314779 RepID=A0A6A6EPV0_9PEZI|nr:hypothetical protein K469DRAFT_694784 [Zopfia rhizophila CBS 207.26]
MRTTLTSLFACRCHGIPPGLAKDEYEAQFGINHLSWALFIELLFPLLEKTAEEKDEVRIISIASIATSHISSGEIAFDSLWTTQEDEKLAEQLWEWTQEQLKGIE